ncbi:MAG: RHS repeat-associated core domain-containing protein [Chromatiales bacterium]|nr:RHS repeat-associated core domain-containing protein [Chromatiales bacterium]
MHTKTEGAVGLIAAETAFMHHDALGSVDTVTDLNARVIDRQGFDPFGGRRTGEWAPDGAGPAALALKPTNRGFTGHEQIDEIGLIHMNGRVYDPTLGRFLSADPIVGQPLNTQAYNRYAYALNNPLKYTDPSGHSPLLIAPVLAALAKVVSAELALPVIAQVAVVATVTYIGTYIATGGNSSAALSGVVVLLAEFLAVSSEADPAYPPEAAELPDSVGFFIHS